MIETLERIYGKHLTVSKAALYLSPSAKFADLLSWIKRNQGDVSNGLLLNKEAVQQALLISLPCQSKGKLVTGSVSVKPGGVFVGLPAMIPDTFVDRIIAKTAKNIVIVFW